MNNRSGAVAEKESPEARFLKLEAMAYQHGMTTEEYAIASATWSPLPEPKTEAQMFADLRGDLEGLKAEGMAKEAVDRAIAKLGWIELISQEPKSKKASSPKAQKGESTKQAKAKTQQS
jgi:hypothetical protein